MIDFSTTILQFDQQGEKTGWMYINVPAALAEQLRPGYKKSFRVRGKLDGQPVSGIALLPMGGGDFIIPFNAVLRKLTGKRKGAVVRVQLAPDKVAYQLNKAFLECLEDEPPASAYFKSLPSGHQNYFRKWIESAKTEITRDKRITQAVTALARKMGYSEMMRDAKLRRDELM